MKKKELFFLIFLGSLCLMQFTSALQANIISYNFTNLSDRNAWSGYPTARQIFNGTAPSANATTTEYTDIQTRDDVFASEWSRGASDEPFWRFNFTVKEANNSRASIQWLTLNVTGKDNATESGENATIGLWNFSSGALVNMPTVFNTTNRNASINFSGNVEATNFIQSSSGNVTVYIEGPNFDGGDAIFIDFVQVDIMYTTDTESPKWQDNSTNNTNPLPSVTVRHDTNWTDDVALSYAILEVNSSGSNCDTLANVTNTTLSGTSSWANLSWQLANSCEGKTISWRQYSNDSSNNWNVTDSQTYNAQNVNPLASFGTNPIDNLNSSTGSLTFDLKISDNLAVNGSKLYGNWTGTWHVNQTNSSPFNDTFWNVTVAGIPEGKWIWAAWGNDTIGNFDFTDVNRTFTVDLTNPSSTINSPANNTWTIDNTPSLNLTLIDNFDPSISYNIWLNDSINKSGSILNATSTNVTLDALPDGFYLIIAQATDDSGRQANSSILYLKVDVTVPQILFGANTEANATSKNQNYVFANTTINETNLKNITFTIQNSTGIVNQTTYLTSITQINWTSLLNTDVQYWYNVSLYDQANNFNITETRYITLTSNQAPQVTIIYPLNTTYTVNVSQLNYSATDDTAVSFCWYSLDQGTTNSSPSASCTNFTGLTSSEGSNTWRVYANDSLGVLNSSTTTFFKDTVFPQFTNHQKNISSPNEDKAVQINVTVTESNKDDVILEFNNGTARNHTITINVSDEYYFTIAGGNYTAHDSITYYWYANDTLGNMNRSSQESFTIANQAPSVSAPAINDTTPTTDYMISCDGGTFSDNDAEDAQQVRYFVWYENDVAVSGQTSQTLSLSVTGLDKADVIKCSVRVYDGFDNSSWVNSSNTATIQNSVPAITNALTTVSWDANGTTFTYDYDATDADSDSLVWYDNTTLFDINQTGYISDTPAESEKGTYPIRISVSDGTNVTDDFVYTINDVTFPLISYELPTESNNSNLSKNYVHVNVTASDSNLNTITIKLYNSSYSLLRTNYSLTSPFFINYTGLSVGYYYFNATANDTTNNQNSTETRNVSLQAPTLNITRPENETYLSITNLPLNFTASLQDSMLYNIDNGSNTTLTANTTFNTTAGFHTLYLFANNSVGTASKKISFTVNATKIIISYNNYSGSTRGASTDFNTSTYENLQNLSGIILENTDHGKIVFTTAINVTDDSIPSDNSLDLDSNVNVSNNSIDLSSTAIPNFNTTATLYLYNLAFTNPRVLRNGEICDSSICTEVNYSGGTFVFNVTSFTNYSTEETLISETSSASSGGSSGEVGSPECTSDQQCTEDESCFEGRCVKLFDIKIVEFESPAKLGEFFNFIYFIKGMARINGDVTVDFWIENSSGKVTSGRDVIYLSEYEERTESTKIFLPRSVVSGVYEFYVQVSYGSYTVSSQRTIELEVGEDGVVTLGTPTTEPDMKTFLIIIVVVLLFFFLAPKVVKGDLRKDLLRLSKAAKKFGDDTKKDLRREGTVLRGKEIRYAKTSKEKIDEVLNQLRKQTVKHPLVFDSRSAKKANTKKKNLQKERIDLQKTDADLIEQAVEETERRNKARQDPEEEINETEKKNKEPKNI